MADKEQRDVMMTSSCIDSCSADRIKQPPFDFIYFLGKMKLKSAPPSGWKVKIMGQRFNAFGCRYFRQVLTSVESDCVPRIPWNTENIGHGWWNGWWNERLEQQGRRLLVFWNRVAAAVAIGLESGSAIRNAAHWKLFQAVVHDGHFFLFSIGRSKMISKTFIAPMETFPTLGSFVLLHATGQQWRRLEPMARSRTISWNMILGIMEPSSQTAYNLIPTWTVSFPRRGTSSSLIWTIPPNSLELFGWN